MNISFEFPFLLPLSIFALVSSMVFWKKEFERIKKLQELVHSKRINLLTLFVRIKEDGTVSYRNFYIYSFLAILSITSLTIAIASPYIPGGASIEGGQKNIYIVIDSSYSMYANDNLQQSEYYSETVTFRNKEARLHAIALVQKLDGMNFGIFTFSGKALQHTYPIDDKEWLMNVLLKEVNVFDPEFSGTNFREVLLKILESSKYESNGFQVVLYSDGDASDEEKAEVQEILKTYTEMNIPIHVVGMGTTEGAEVQYDYNRLKLESIDQDRGGDLAGEKYSTQETVVVQTRLSKLDRDFLQKIAESTGGLYLETAGGDTGIEKLQKKINQKKNQPQQLLLDSGEHKNISKYFYIIPFLFLLYDYYFFRGANKYIVQLYKKQFGEKSK